MKKKIIAVAAATTLTLAGMSPVAAQQLPQPGTESSTSGSSTAAFFDLPDDVRNWIVTLVALPFAGSSFLVSLSS